MVTWTRRLLAAAWVAALVSCVAVALFARLADGLVITGRSMEPAIPRGSFVTLADDEAVAVGDVVTVRADSGVMVTHRVVRTIETTDGTLLELRGDANDAVDPSLAPISAVVGTVDLTVPYVGYLVAMLGMPIGLLGVVAFLAAGVLTVWWLEDVESARTALAA
jgi:signal peptidase